MRTIHVGVLVTGEPAPALLTGRPEEDQYAVMFLNLLQKAAGPVVSIRVTPYEVLRDQFPTDVKSADAWLVTGSKSGANDTDEWIARLADFLRAAIAAQIPVVGICFGHQLLAKAMGGTVQKYHGGWGIGVHSYSLAEQVVSAAPWMKSHASALDNQVSLLAMHQDQVVELPTNTTVFAHSDFCPNAALIYGDPQKPLAISFQPHPEFPVNYEKRLIEFRRDNHVIGKELCDQVLDSLQQKHIDADLAGQWIVQYLLTVCKE